VVDAADLVVDQPAGEAVLADRVLRPVGRAARSALGPGDPKPAVRLERGVQLRTSVMDLDGCGELPIRDGELVAAL